MKTKLATIALAFTLLMFMAFCVPVGAESSEELPTIQWINPPYEAIVTFKGEQTHFKACSQNGATIVIAINGVPQKCSFVECGSIYPWGNLVVSGSAKYAWASRFLKTTPYGEFKPTIHIHLDVPTAYNLYETLKTIKFLGEALILPYYAPLSMRGIIREYLCTVGIGTTAYYTVCSDSNTDGSLDLWIPIDNYNYNLWQTTRSLYIGTPNHWWLV